MSSIHDKHLEKLARKHEALEGKKALLEMWENDPDCPHEYLLELRRKVRSLHVQLMAMRPAPMSEAD